MIVGINERDREKIRDLSMPEERTYETEVRVEEICLKNKKVHEGVQFSTGEGVGDEHEDIIKTWHDEVGSLYCM